MTGGVRCAWCGGTLTLDRAAETEVVVWQPGRGTMPGLTTRRLRVPVLACNDCENIIRLDIEEPEEREASQ